MRRVVYALLVMIVVVLVGARPAHAATMTASPSSVTAGDSVTVAGSAAPGCSNGAQVTLLSRAFAGQGEFAGVPAVTATVDANSNFSRRVVISSSVSPGTYSITGRCGGGNLGVQATLTVTAGGTTPATTAVTPTTSSVATTSPVSTTVRNGTVQTLPQNLATTGDVDSAKKISYVAIGVAAVAVVLAASALILGRRRT